MTPPPSLAYFQKVAGSRAEYKVMTNQAMMLPAPRIPSSPRSKRGREGKSRQRQQPRVCGEDINRRDAEGRTLLHLSAIAGDEESCLATLGGAGEAPGAGTDEVFTAVNARDLQKKTALHCAAENGLAWTCEVLLRRSDFKEVNALDASGCTALHSAIKGGSTEAALAILGHGDFVEVNARDSGTGRTPFQAAARAGLDEVCAAILNNRNVDINLALNGKDTTGRNAVQGALVRAGGCPRQYVAVCLRILGLSEFSGVNDVDPETGRTLLHAVAFAGLPEVAEAILARPDFAGVNKTDGAGLTALHQAALVSPRGPRGDGAPPASPRAATEVANVILGREDFVEAKMPAAQGVTALAMAKQGGMVRIASSIQRRRADQLWKLWVANEEAVKGNIAELFEPADENTPPVVEDVERISMSKVAKKVFKGLNGVESLDKEDEEVVSGMLWQMDDPAYPGMVTYGTIRGKLEEHGLAPIAAPEGEAAPEE